METAPVLPDGFPRPFGSYVLLSAFAQGGMGEVYLAKTGGLEGIERVCVLKKLRPDFGTNQEYVNRFLDEARVVVQLSHANIAHVFDVGKVEDEYYLAMEYVSGVSLKALLARAFERGQPVSPQVALYAMSEALLGLDYAHRLEHPLTGKPLHLVHRDVSPHNVMVSYEGEVKLIDFGLADSELKEEQTESQVVMGKVAYMSPEQARGERVTGRCDQFAAAVVTYELLAHDRFYGEMTNYQIWQVVGRGGFTPRRWGALDPPLQRILSRALHGDPRQRFESCGDFREALLEYLLSRYPRTSRRTVREHMRELFEGATERERAFLKKTATISAAALRAAHGLAEEDLDGHSIIRAPDPKPLPEPEPEPVPERAAQPPTRVIDPAAVEEVSSPSAFEKAYGSKGARIFVGAALALALVIVSASASYFFLRATKSGKEEPSDEVVAVLLPAEPSPEPPREPPPEAAAATPVGAAVEPAVEPEEADADAPPASAKAPKRAQKSQTRRPTTAKQARVAAVTTTKKSEEAKAASSPTGAERVRGQNEPSATRPATREAAAEAWRARVIPRLERCAPCARTFLERGKLETLPAARLTDEVRVSVETCLRQCESP